jgi:hypothetical protein
MSHTSWAQPHNPRLYSAQIVTGRYSITLTVGLLACIYHAILKKCVIQMKSNVHSPVDAESDDKTWRNNGKRSTSQ